MLDLKVWWWQINENSLYDIYITVFHTSRKVEFVNTSSITQLTGREVVLDKTFVLPAQ